MSEGRGRQFIINMPGTWECRRTLQNVLRVLWLDVFERAGWLVTSAADCGHGGVPPVPSTGGSQQPADSKTVATFEGECTNFILFKHAPSTSSFSHAIDHRELPLSSAKRDAHFLSL